MNKHKHAQWGLLGATLALTAGALAVVPGLANTVDDPVEAVGATPVPTGTIEIAGATVTYSVDGGTQTLANGQGCKLEPESGNLLAFSGGAKSVGFVDGSIGVKSKGNGQDCGQIDGTEELTIDLGTATALDGQAIFKADLDIEVLQDAGVTATISFVDGTKTVELDSFTLASGSAAPPAADNTPESTTAVPDASCNPQSSSGPNAGDADNCFWTIISDTPFNRLVLTENAGGKASLQGGGDWPSEGPGGPSVLYLTDAPEGILDCGDVIEVGDASLGGVITRLGDPADPACLLKPYNFQIDGDRVEFEPSGAPGAQYSGVIRKSIPEPPATDPTSLEWIEYDKDGDGPFGFVPMQWCENGDLLVGSTLPTGDEVVGTVNYGPATWCVYAVDLSDPSGGNVTASYSVYGEDDPHWR